MSGAHRRLTVVAAAAAASATAAVLRLSARPHVVAPGVRSAMETAIMITALLSAIALGERAGRTRSLRDFSLMGAMLACALTDVTSPRLPTISNSATFAGAGARMAAMALVAAAFLASACTPGRRRFRPDAWRGCLVPVAGGAIAAIAGAGALMAGTPARADYSAALTVVTILSTCAMGLAATRFVVRGVVGRTEAALLAAAVLLLAGGWLGQLAGAPQAGGWVTPDDFLHCAAYGLLLIAAVRLRDRTRDEQAGEAVEAERVRIARDLHDGLAQDLAFIAAHSERLAAEMGDQHPVAIAARRALAAARLEIVDLSASRSGDLGAALRAVAAELALRFSIDVQVRTDDADLETSLTERDELVRIAREAIVNAATRGGARHVTVTLGARWCDVRLRVCDDGCGFGAPEARALRGTGLGLLAMRARARLLGGELRTGSTVQGGAEVVVAARPSPALRAHADRSGPPILPSI